MASNNYSDLRTLDAVMKMFDQQNTPFYEVYQGKDLKFDSIDHAEDMEDAREFLEQQLKAIEHFGSAAQFKINFYRNATEKGKLENLKASNTFKLNEQGVVPVGSYWDQRNNSLGAVGPKSELQEIKEMLVAQQSQINALLEDPDEDEEEEQPGAVGGVMGMLAGMLNNPAVQEAIAAKIIGFVNTIIPDPSGKTMTMQPRTQLAGISQEDIVALNAAVMTMIENGVQVTDFQKLATLTADRQKFDMLLGMLRSM